MIEILLSTYNGERFLAEQLDSLLAQDFQDWRLLVRDDGSSDDTVRILKEYAARHPEKVRLVDEPGRNLGACLSFGELLNHSQAELVMFCDQDDVWLPDKISSTYRKFVELQKRHGVEAPLLVFTDATVVDVNLKVIAKSMWRYQHSDPYTAGALNRILMMNPANGCTMLVNRALIRKALPIPPEAVMHDCWLLWTAAAFGSVDCLPQSTLLYRQHGRNESVTRRWTLSGFLSAAGNTAAFHDFHRSNRKQARVFLERYTAGLPDGCRSAVAAYLRLDALGAGERFAEIIKNRLLYVGLLRNVGWLLMPAWRKGK